MCYDWKAMHRIIFVVKFETLESQVSSHLERQESHLTRGW